MSRSTRALQAFYRAGEHLLDPDHREADALFASIRGVEDPAEAWESLNAQGVVDDAWLGHAPRHFLPEPPPRIPARGRWFERALRAVTTTPPTLDAAVLLACDPQGVLRAEEAALEWYTRSAALHEVAPFGGVAWWVPPYRTKRWEADLAPEDAKIARAALEGMNRLESESELPARREAWPEKPRAAIQKAEAAQEAAARGASEGPFEELRRNLGDALVPVRNAFVAAVGRTVLFHEAQRYGARLVFNTPGRGRRSASSAWRDHVEAAAVRNPFAPKVDVYDAGYAWVGAWTVDEAAPRLWVVLATFTPGYSLPARVVAWHQEQGP